MVKATLFTILFGVIFSFSLVSQVQVISINPAQTDSRVKPIHSDHLALINTLVKPVNKLVLMLVGTGASSADNLPFDSFAAAIGFHVISLDYKNTVITTACTNSEDSSCFNGFRQEIVFGEPVSPVVEVDSANSIYNRFYVLLLWLAKKYPEQQWQQYIHNNTVQWSKIIVAGHSQGAGHAAYLGKKFPVNRVLIFAGPQDYLVRFNSPASWLSQKSATSSSKYFAFLHRKDPFDFNKQLAGCLKLMQTVKADTVLVQPGVAVKSYKHILVANIETSNPHGSMLQLQFVKAWTYLLSPLTPGAKK